MSINALRAKRNYSSLQHQAHMNIRNILMMFILLVIEKLETLNSKKEKVSNNPGGTATILQRIKTLGSTLSFV